MQPPKEPSAVMPGFDVVLPFRHQPRPPHGYTVIRKDLLRHLTEASLLKQLSVVWGPAGAGKSTLLTQWRTTAQEMARPVAWLTVDAMDLGPEAFVAGLATSLDFARCAQLADAFRAIRSDMAERSNGWIGQHLAAACNASAERPIIVLDQYELMDSAAAGEIISGFLSHAAAARIVIASRTRPSIPLGSLRARDQLFEIGPSDLNFTPLETRVIFDADVPDVYTRRLHLETSGEAVAIGFARRIVEEPPRDMVGAENWHEQLNEYYRAEVLEALPNDLREAMSRLVVVERFDLSLATALLGRSAAAIIERLHHVDGLLLRHRGTQEFYFSEMLRRFLERRLVWLDDAELGALHARAASWFIDRGRTADALRHAVAAGDQAKAQALLQRIGYNAIVAQHGVSATYRLLEAAGATAEASTSCLLSLALIEAHEGDVPRASERLDQAKRQIATEGGDLTLMARGELALAEAFVAAFGDEPLDSLVPTLSDYLDHVPAGDHEARAQAKILLSWERFCAGDMARAETLAIAAAEEYAETEGVYGCIFMHVHRALALFWSNDVNLALQEMTLAERMTRVFFPEDHRLRAMTGVLRAGLLFETGRTDPLADFTGLVGAVGALDHWSDIQIWSHLQGARAARAAGRPEEARGILGYGREVARRLGAARLDWHMQVAQIVALLDDGDVGQAQAMAAAAAIDGARFLEAPRPGWTWQERIVGVLAAVRLAETDGDRADRRRLVERARAEIAATGVPRAIAMLALLEARLAHGQGDIAAAKQSLQAARDACPAGLPIRLFLDAGPWVQELMPEIATWAIAPPASALPVQAVRTLDERDPLTARERQILLFMGEGHPNKVAAYRLGLSEATVKFHLRNIYRKLNAQNRTQALARYRSFADVR